MDFDLAGATKAGYSPAEIADYLGSQSGFDVSGARQSGYSDSEILKFLVPPGGFIASAKQMVGSTIKGAGQVAADFIPGVSEDNALKRYGQLVVDENPTAVHSFEDIANKPLTAVTEAAGNAAGSVAGMVGARAVGSGITAMAPLAGPAAPVVAGIGQAISWLGPWAIAALPSFSGIRDKQILNDPENEADAKSKAIAALGAVVVGKIETTFGPQNWALAAMTKEGRDALAKKFVATTIPGKIAEGVVKGGLIEGGEELAQNPIEQLASYDDPRTWENVKQTLFGGAMGAIGGGVLGGAFGPAFGKQPGLINSAAQEQPEPSPEPAIEPTPPVTPPVESSTPITQDIADTVRPILQAQSLDDSIEAFSQAVEPVGRDVAEGMSALPDRELMDFIQSEQRDQQAILAEQQTAQRARAEFERNAVGATTYDTEPVTPAERATLAPTEPLTEDQRAVARDTGPLEPTAIELALQNAQERRQQQIQEDEARTAAQAAQAQEQAKQREIQARLPQAEDLPVLESLIKRQPVDEADGARLVDKGLARLREDGSFGINERGFKARNQLLRGMNRVDEPGVVAPRTVAGIPESAHTDEQLRELVASPDTPAITRHAAVTALQARQSEVGAAPTQLPSEATPALAPVQTTPAVAGIDRRQADTPVAVDQAAIGAENAPVISAKNPLRLFHATGADVTTFDTGEKRAPFTTSPDALGAWFAAEPKLAERIHAVRSEEAGMAGEDYNGRTYPVTADIKNPLVVKTRAALNNMVPVGGTTADLKADLIKQGYDGVKVLDDYGMGESYVAFRADQVRPAISAKPATTVEPKVDTTTPAKTVYHGGKLEGDLKPGMFVHPEKAYAEKFASQTGGNVSQFELPDNAKIYPETFGWEQYRDLWRKDQLFKGYDAVRVIEPNGQGESLAILNPSILTADAAAIRKVPPAVDKVAPAAVAAPEGGTKVVPSESSNSPTGESFPNVTPAAVEVLRNAVNRESFRPHGFSGLDIPTQRVVLNAVREVVNNKEIFDSVVSGLPVDVMNVLARQKFTPKMLFHDKAMLADFLSRGRIGKLNVGRSTSSGVIRALANRAAEHILVPNDLASRSNQGGTAEGTIDNRHDVAPISNVVTGAGGVQAPSVPTSVSKGAEDIKGIPGAAAGTKLLAKPTGQPVGGYYATDSEGKTIGHRQPGDSPRRFKTAQMADLWARQEIKRREKVAPVESADIGYQKLLSLKSTKLLSSSGGRNLHEVIVTPEFRKKHFVNGRAPISDSFELKRKEEVTGNPSDNGYILIDKREQTKSRQTAQPAPEVSKPSVAKPAVSAPESTVRAAAAKLESKEQPKAEAKAGEAAAEVKPAEKVVPAAPVAPAAQPNDGKARFNRNDQLSEESLNAFADATKEKYGLTDFNLSIDKQGNIELDRIEVPRSDRKSGKGSAAMTDLTAFADQHGARIWLSVADQNDNLGTTSKERLKSFYRRFGFVVNKGRNKDFRLSVYATMYRNPEGSVFSRAPSLTIGIKPEDASAVIARYRLAMRGAPKVNALETVEALREKDGVADLLNQIYKEGAQDFISGAWHNGEIYLFANHLNSVGHAGWVLMHESTHHGLRGLVGNNINPLMVDIYTTNKWVREQANALMKKDSNLSTVRATEEVLANMGGDNIPLPVMQKLMAAIRKILRQIGIVDQWTDNDIKGLIQDALGTVKNPTKTGWMRGTTFARINDTGSQVDTSNPESAGMLNTKQLAQAKRIFNAKRWYPNPRELVASQVVKDAAGNVVAVRGPNSRYDGYGMWHFKGGYSAINQLTNEPFAKGVQTNVVGALTVPVTSNIGIGMQGEVGVDTKDESGSGTDMVHAASKENINLRANAVLTGKPTMPEGGPNGYSSNAKALSDLFESEAFRLHGLGGLDIPTQREVIHRVLALGENSKILDAIVSLSPRPMMDILSRQKLTPEMLFHDGAVLKNLLSVDGKGSVSTAVNVADALVSAITGVATKDVTASFNPVGTLEGNSAAPRAGNGRESSDSHGQIVSGIKSTGNNGQFDPQNKDILFSRSYPEGSADEETQNALAESPAGKAAGTWEKLSKAKNRIYDAIDKMSPLGKLPEQDAYLIKRYRALGKLAKISDETHDLYAAFRNAGEHAPDVYAFLTNKDAQPSIIRDAGIRESAVKAKATLMEVGQKLVDQGLLPKEVFEAHRGEYLPRIYLRHLLDDDAISALSTGKKPSDMGYLKARKDIPEDVRRLILGEITDPAYLVSKAYGTQMRDVALLDWLSEIAQEKAWVMPNSLVEWDGRKVTPFWLKETAKQIRRQALHYTESDRKEAKSLADRMDETADEALEGYGGVPDGWKQIPNTPRYGRLRGLIVKSEIYDDIVGSARINPTDASVAEKVLGNGGIATKLTQLWKWSKVAANPPAQIRNFVSNGVLLHLSGVQFHMVIPRVIQAIREIRTNGQHWQIAKEFGVTESTFAAQELFRIEREFLDLQARGASPLSIATAKNLASKVMSFTSDIYQLSEAIFKTAKIIDSMQKGQTQEQAVLDAQKWMFDYSLVTPSMRYLRNAPVGAPFITFYFKALPRLLEVATTHPLRLAPYLAIPYVLTAMLASMADVDDDDVDKLKKALPEWLQERGNAYFLPMKDDKGRWVAMDIGYFLPWTMWQELGTELVKGEFGKAMQGSGMLGGPLPDLISAIKTNKDPFSKKEIVSEFDPPAKQIAGVMGYLYSMSMPTWLTNYGFAGHMYNALNETVDKHGQIKDTEGQAMMRLFGVNLYPINPEQTRADNLRRMKFEIQEEKRRRTIQIRDRNLTPEKRAEVAQEYNELIKKRTQDMFKYAQESRVHPNLRTGVPQ